MDTPALFYMHEGSNTEKVLIYIPGLCSEDTTSLEEEKQNAILKAGWKGDIYYLWWDASVKSRFIKKSFVRLFVPIVKSKYENKRDAASKTGREHLPHLIWGVAPSKEVTFVAHSLGAHMLYELFRNPVDYPMRNSIEDVILLGGALSAEKKEWRQTDFRKLINVYNTNDSTLINWFPIGEMSRGSIPERPCGVKAIEEDCVSEVINIDISDDIESSHDRYYEVFSNGMLKYRRGNWIT